MVRGNWGNPLHTEFDQIALVMAHEKVAPSAEDILNMTYERLLIWNAQLELRAKKLIEQQRKNGNIRKGTLSY